MVYETFTLRVWVAPTTGRSMERAVFDRMAELDQDHWWFLARRRILDALIGRVVRPGEQARILEVGCGTGHNLAMLGRFGKVEACELDRSRAGAGASKRLGRKVKDARLPDLSMFERNGYDLVALLDVLEHVPDDIGSLRAIHRRLKPGGALLVTVPANPWMWSAHDVAHHHFRRYTRFGLAQAVRAGRVRGPAAELFQQPAVPADRGGAADRQGARQGQRGRRAAGGEGQRRIEHGVRARSGTDRPRADAVRSEPGRGGAAAAGAVKPARIRAARKH